MESRQELKRSIGLPGVVVTLVGFVIGVSIFILPGHLAASAGPAVILSYFIASLMAVFSCVVAAQIGAVFPVSGASFIAVSRLISPFWGFATVWFILGTGAIGVALLAYGFADYLAIVWPGVNRMTAAVSLVLALGGLNLLGARETVFGQALMVAAFMVALCVFAVAGMIHMDTRLLDPFVPNGPGAVLSAAIPAFFSYSGFMVIIEIGGEIRRPGKTVPAALAISFLIVFLVYTSVTLAIVAVVPWQELIGVSAPVTEAARRILPDWVATAITLTAVAASASSINALLLSYSRDLLALARVRVLPGALAGVSRRSGEPSRAVLVITALSVLSVLAGAGIADYATLTVIGLMFFQIMLGLAALRMPATLGERYARSDFKLRGWKLPFFAVGLMVCSAAFLLIVLVDSPRFILLAGAYLCIGAVYYEIRRRLLTRRGIRVQSLIGEEVARMEAD